MPSSTSGSFNIADPALPPLAQFLDEHAGEIVLRAERAWESTILLFTQLSQTQREQLRNLGEETVRVWAIRLRQDPSYAQRVPELGRRWGEQAAGWQLHVYSFTKALELLIFATWEYLAERYPMDRLSPATVFLLGRSRDQVLDDVRIPLMSTYLSQREIEMEKTHFTLESALSLPGRSLLLELGTRLQGNKDRVIPAWIASTQLAPDVSPGMVELLNRRAADLLEQLLFLLQSPTPEASAISLSEVRKIGLESAQQGVPFREMFHALQQLRPILWDTIYEIYRREQYWHAAEFIEVLARLHLLLDLFSEGIGQAYILQKETIIQQQAEEIHRRDLNLARDMLESLLPDRDLTFSDVEVSAAWLPTREIGGDFFDVFPLENGDLLFLLGDVSGKGVSAALLVSMVKYVIKANAPFHASPAALCSAANKLFYQDMGPELFVTLFAARYSPADSTLVYTSAGHDTCFLARADRHGHADVLPSLGPILGVFAEVELTDERLDFAPGDVLFMYTDGLVDARCPGQARSGMARVSRSIRQQMEQPIAVIVQQVLDELIGGCELTDDVTVLAVKRREGAIRHG
jgi:serine phosphatase RsbU (regulator of sigma subunit)